MKKNKNLVILFLILIVVTIISCNHSSKKEKAESEETEIPLNDRMDLAWAQEKEMTMDRSLGTVPTERLIAAFEQAKLSTNYFSRNGLGAINNFNWIPVGPKNNGGRTRSLCVDLNDATRNTVFAGSVGGGLWKTTNINTAEPNWTPVNDLFGNIAVTAIAQDPSNTQNLYFGTGEGYGNIDNIRGLGVWKSSDGGATWNQLSSTNNSNFYYCFKMKVSSTGILYVCTSNGLYRSADAGVTFTRVLGTTVCYDIDIAANGDVYASIVGGVYKSTNGGTAWGSALPIGITASRIEVALAPSDANTVYVLCESANVVNGIAVSSNGGTSFTTKTEPADADSGIPATDFSRTQAWYDLTIEVNPSNKDEIFVGGVDIFKSSDAATTWQQVSHWYGGFGFQDVHADQHYIIFSPGSSTIAYFLNDGSIYRTTNATALIPTLTSKEINYNTSQFYSCAMSPTYGDYSFLAGAQDNGTHRLNSNAITNSVQVTGGDGMFCHIDQNDPQFWFSSYVYNNYYKSSNSGNSFSGSVSPDVSPANSGRFINPTDYDDAANILYCCRGSNQYLRWDNTTSASPTFTTVTLSALGGQISNIKVSPNTANRVFMSTSGGVILKVDNANTATPTATSISTGLPASYVSSVEVETGNDNHLLVTFSNYGTNSIWESTNGGTSWTSVEGNLPDMPVRWALFNPNNSSQAVIATELGVWSTDLLNGASTVWGASNTGLANVRVDMLQVRQSDKLIIAATHGRGLYYSGVFAPVTADFAASISLAYVQREIQFTNTSFGSTSYAWDFGDGTTSTVANPKKKYNSSGTFNVTLSINGGASTKIKSIVILPKRATPYLIANGGNFEINAGDYYGQLLSGSNWERGNSAVAGKNGTNSGSSAWVTSLTGNYLDNSVTYLYGPNYTFANAGTYNFSFYTKYNVETNYDGLIVEYSLDTGKVWTPLGSTVLANWYNFANVTDNTAFPLGQAFFTGSVANYTKQNYDVSFLAGNTNVAFRFAFKADGSVNAAGVAVDDVEITGPANALPVTITNFKAKWQNKNAYLNWNTNSEINTSNFEIERSLDGFNFTKVGDVTAVGIGANSYSFIDFLNNINLGNVVYYRLKAIDLDGTFKYSNIETLRHSKNNLISFSPNPFVNLIQISSSYSVYDIQLLNTNGQVVFYSKNTNNSIYVPNYISPGMYIIKANTSNGLFTDKIMKL